MSASKNTTENKNQSAGKKTLIQVRNISFSYDTKTVLENINFDIYEQEFIGLIGANGSGKTTLIKILLGLEKAQSGSIQFFGSDISALNSGRNIAYISQRASHFNLSFPATVEEVVMTGLYSKIGLFKRPSSEDYAEVEKALIQVDMQNFQKQLIGTLSGGQLQRVLLAKALIGKPKILFLDEPTAGVDSKNEIAIYKLLKNLNHEQKICIILISHDIAAVTEYTQRLFCLGPDGFFIHNAHTSVEGDFLDKIYGYKVIAHEHISHSQENCPYCNHR